MISCNSVLVINPNVLGNHTSFSLPSANEVMFSIVHHVTITHDALDLSVQGPHPPRHGTSLYKDTPPPGPFMDMGPHCTGRHLLVTFGGKNLIPV